MHLKLLTLSLLYLAPKCLLADVIHQWPAAIAVQQGEEVVLNCYQNDTVRNMMLWYRQVLGQGLALVGSSYKGSEAQYEKGFKPGFEITRTMEDKMSTLTIKKVKPGDWAEYFCAASDGAQRCEHTRRPDKNRSREMSGVLADQTPRDDINRLNSPLNSFSKEP